MEGLKCGICRNTNIVKDANGAEKLLIKALIYLAISIF